MNSRKYNRAYYAKTATFVKLPWTMEHDKMVMAHMVPDREISEITGHSMMAIQIRRSRLKKED